MLSLMLKLEDIIAVTEHMLSPTIEAILMAPLTTIGQQKETLIHTLVNTVIEELISPSLLFKSFSAIFGA